MTLQSLINKRDSFEIIRDQIAAILATEIMNQRALAVSQSLNPDDWGLRVFSERASPVESFPDKTEDSTPVANVWFDSINFIDAGSNVMERQKAEGSFNIDVYGFGRSRAAGTGHDAGDKTAALQAQRAIRLIRNILMAAENTYLGLRGLVGGRRFQSITSMQPQQDANNIFHVVGARLNLVVNFNEFSPQTEPVELEGVSAQVFRQETGEVIVSASYDYT